MMSTVLDGLLVLTALWAASVDLRSRRIPNWLTLGSSAGALAVRVAAGGGPALAAGGAGWLLGAALFFLPFALGWMGAGDVKLLAAFGALGGPAFLLQTAVAGCLAGGVIAAGYLLWRRRLTFFMWHVVLNLGHPVDGILEGKRRIPYAPALALGALAVLALSAMPYARFAL